MKAILFTLFCIVVFKTSYAQRDLLAFDEHNKYIFYQVVNMPGIPADSLYNRSADFLKIAYPKTKIKPAGAGVLTAKGKFLVYGGLSVLKHEKGEVEYTLNIECKDTKYRYWLTNFTFTPYVRDRYNNFVPKQGEGYPLETIASKFDKRDAAGYLDETGTFCKQFGDSLKQYVSKAATPKKEEAVKKVVTDKW